MGLASGRPDLERYAPLFDVPAGREGPGVTFLGEAGIGRLDALVPVHTHFDHELDSTVVADRCGAVLAGGDSAANIGRGHGLAEDRIRVVRPAEPLTSGSFTLTLVESHHCPPDRFPGRITEPVVPPVKAAAY